MAVDRTPVLKRCRSLGMEPMYLGIDKKSNRKPNRSNRKQSEYGLQLREKQKAKFIYGVLEKPFRNLYAKAEQQKGLTGPNLMTLLELRLDNIIFRLGFARTRREARQLVNHGHFLVNGKRVDIPSYRIKVGDVISLRDKSKSSPKFKANVEETNGRIVPLWLEVNKDEFSAKVTRMPNIEDLDYDVEAHLIVELYSK